MKKFLIALASLLPVVLVLGCNPPGSSTSPVTTAQAKTVAQASLNGVTAVMNGTWSETVSGTSATVSYSGTGSSTGVNMNGTLAGVGSNPETFMLTITFSNYVDTSGYKVNGSVTLSLTMNTLTNAVSGALTGNLTFSGGQAATATCNITIAGTGGAGSTNLVFSGTLTVNGTSFDASTLGLQTSISSPYTTIAWQPDGTGWTQFKTNDPSKMGYLYYYLLPGSSLTVGVPVKIGIKQMSGTAQANIGLVFGYLNSGSYWVHTISSSQLDEIAKWNGLSWQNFSAGQLEYINQGANVENDLTITYDGTNVNFTINGTFSGTEPNVSGLAGSQFGFVVEVDSTENFPAIPLDVRFKQY